MKKDQEIAQLMRETIMLQMMRERLKQQTEELKKAVRAAESKSSVAGS